MKPNAGACDSYAMLCDAEKYAHTIEIVERATGKRGVANTCADGVEVFYGADDGSDDKTITPEDFNRDFEITAVIWREAEKSNIAKR